MYSYKPILTTETGWTVISLFYLENRSKYVGPFSVNYLYKKEEQIDMLLCGALPSEL